MKLKAITIGCAKTINLGNFQSMRVECVLTAEPEPGDTYEAVVATLQEDLRDLLRRTYKEQRARQEADDPPAQQPSADDRPPATFTPATPPEY